MFKRRVTVYRCKPCRNANDVRDKPKYLPAGLTPYVVNKHTATPPRLYHVTAEDGRTPPERLSRVNNWYIYTRLNSMYLHN